MNQIHPEAKFSPPAFSSFEQESKILTNEEYIVDLIRQVFPGKRLSATVMIRMLEMYTATLTETYDEDLNMAFLRAKHDPGFTDQDIQDLDTFGNHLLASGLRRPPRVIDTLSTPVSEEAAVIQPKTDSDDPLSWLPPKDPASSTPRPFPWTFKESKSGYIVDKNPDFANSVDDETYERFYSDQKISVEGKWALRSIAYVYDQAEKRLIDSKGKEIDFEPIIANQTFEEYMKWVSEKVTDNREYNIIIDYIESRRDQLEQLWALVARAGLLGIEVPTTKELKRPLK